MRETARRIAIKVASCSEVHRHFSGGELEQNSHIVCFDAGGAQIAIEGSESSLIARASIALHQLFGTSEDDDSAFRWVRCETDDGRLTGTIFEERQREAARYSRKTGCRSHDAIRLAKQILGAKCWMSCPENNERVGKIQTETNRKRSCQNAVVLEILCSKLKDAGQIKQSR